MLMALGPSFSLWHGVTGTSNPGLSSLRWTLHLPSGQVMVKSINGTMMKEKNQSFLPTFQFMFKVFLMKQQNRLCPRC